MANGFSRPLVQLKPSPSSSARERQQPANGHGFTLDCAQFPPTVMLAAVA